MRSHLAKIRRRWRPKVIFISQASISEDIWSVEKMRNLGKIHQKWTVKFLVDNAENTPNVLVLTIKRQAAKIFDDV